MNAETKISLREKILMLAQQNMTTRGQLQLSLRQIASEVGVTPMAIYRHFANKEDLQLALLDVGFRRFSDCLSRSQTDAPPLERLDLLAEGFIEFAIDNPGFFELMFLSSQVPVGLRNREAMLAVSRPTYAMLSTIIIDCIAARNLPDGKPDLIAQDLLAFCIGQAALFISGVMNWSADEARSQCRAAFTRHLRVLAARSGETAN